jgi:hypothetical protein
MNVYTDNGEMSLFQIATAFGLAMTIVGWIAAAAASQWA